MPKDLKEVSCFFCKIGKAKYWFLKTSIDDKKSYPIYTCKNCKGGFVFPIPTSEYLSSYYASSTNSMEANLTKGDIDRQYEQVLEDEKCYPNSTIDSTRIAANLKKMCIGNKALDIGGGYGFFSRELMKLGFEVESIELNEKARKVYERMNGFQPQNISFDANFAAKNLGKYDAVLLSQVLEHLPMDQDPIKNIQLILKADGVCVIAVPHFRSLVSRIQDKNDMFIVPPEHINFFTINALCESFGFRGFQNIHIATISRYNYKKVSEKFKFSSWLIIFPLKLILYLSDRLQAGMFINAYFKKKRVL
jgi:2-polyprenyl-3-methyl-5-hydroxy-6-metoxy-1,4-benzoquinol methylase